MKRARKFVQPMEHTGLPNTYNWAGYEYLQWTGDCIHPGLDYNWGAGEEDKGKDVFVIGNGLVTYCGIWDRQTKGFGNHAFVKHIVDFDYQLGDIKLKKGDVIYSHYCHLDTIDVKEGQEVNFGDKIGTCGGSGGWPSHLHLELRLPIGKGYDFWPKGYSYDWIAKRYIDVYQFIEDNKGGTMSNYYKELDLTNKESMKMCVDIWVEVMKDKLWIKKEECNKKLEELKKEFKNKEKQLKEDFIKRNAKHNKELTELCNNSLKAKKKEYEDSLTNLKDSHVKEIENALKKAKKDWKVDKLKEKVEEYEKVRNTTAYKIAVIVTKVLQKIKLLKKEVKNG